MHVTNFLRATANRWQRWREGGRSKSVASVWAAHRPSSLRRSLQDNATIDVGVVEDEYEDQPDDDPPRRESASTAVSRDPYKYKPLNDNSDEIRILRLLPGQFDDEIRCILSKAKIQTLPRYDAISYAWGDPSVTEPILCNGRRLDVTTNLADALRHLRHQTASRRLWVDAISINQQDIRERGHQVALMADIFSNANKVLVWLGVDSDGGAEHAFSLIGEYVAFVRKETKRLSATSGEFSIRDMQPFYPDGPTHIDDFDLHCVAGIFDRTWFSRVWVLQEVGLATYATAVCGYNTIAFELLVCFARVVFSTSGDLVDRLNLWPVRDAYRHVWSTYGAEATWLDRLPFKLSAEQSKCRIEDVLCTSCSRDVTDKRDYFYAMLGHPAFKDGVQAMLIEPDYTKSFEQVRYDLVKAVITKKGQLSMLSMKQHDVLDEPGTGTSWLPSCGTGARPTIDYPTFTVCRDRLCEAQILGNELRCKGLCIDVVTTTSGALLQVGPDPEICKVSRLADMAKSLWELVRQPETVTRYGVANNLRSLACVLNCQPLAVPDCYRSTKHRQKVVARLSRGLEKCILQTTPIEDPVEASNDAPYATVRAQDNTTTGDEHEFLFYSWRLCRRRQFFITSTGYWGLGPGIIKPGDKCCVLYGSRVPYILRPYGSDGKYKLVGECYILELMEGQAMDMLASGALKESWFTIC